MRLRILFLAAALCAVVALGTLTGAASGASTCHNLKVTATVRAALKAAHGNKDGPIASGSIYYGRCGTTRYAIATFSEALADQPEKFRRISGHRWVDKGDGFENGCDALARRPIPKSLVRIWRVCPTLR